VNNQCGRIEETITMSVIFHRRRRRVIALSKFVFAPGFYLACTACGLAETQTTYSLSWRADSVFSGQGEIVDYVGVVTSYDTTLSALWEGEAKIVQTDDESGGTEFQVAALSYNGYYSTQYTTETHSSTKCGNGPGPQFTETLDTIESDNVLPADQRELFEQRLLSWAEKYLDGDRDMIIDPFKAGDHENCYPANFMVNAVYSDWFTLVKCGIVVTDWGSTWDQDIPISGLTGAEGDLMPIDDERMVYTKTAEGSYDANGEPVITTWEVTLRISTDVCELEVIQQYQDAGLYKNRCYDHVPDPTGTGICPTNNIAGWGCEITAITMALTYGGYPTDPGEFHDFLLTPYPNDEDPEMRVLSLFVNFFFDPVFAVEVFTDWASTYYCLNLYSYLQPDLANSLMEEIVCNKQLPVIVGVQLFDREDGRAGHYVVVTGREGDRWKINDTLLSEDRQFLDEYGDFLVMGYIGPVGAGTAPAGTAESEPDLSKLVILADDTVEIKVLDELGNRTGYDQDQSSVELGIPNSEFAYFGLRYAATGEWWPTGMKMVVIRQPVSDNYRIELEGMDNGAYDVHIHTTDRDGDLDLPVMFGGDAAPGVLEALKVEFDPTPGVPVVVNQIDPLIGGLPVEGLEGWFHSDWFGFYSTAFAPWLFHGGHGFIFRYPASRNASMFVYDHAMAAWWWTGEGVYPFLYAFDPPADNSGENIESAWLWYFDGTKSPRSFGVVTGADAGTVLFFGP
jgi:hypothetical protein